MEVGVRGSAGAFAHPARSQAVAAWEVWKPPAPRAPMEEGRRGTACSLPPAGFLGQLTRVALGNLLTGKLGRETNANVLEELRVTSLGAEALFSFPAPAQPRPDLAKEGCVTSSRLWARSPTGLGAGVPETKVNGGRAQPSPAADPSPPRRVSLLRRSRPPPQRGFLLGDLWIETSWPGLEFMLHLNSVVLTLFPVLRLW